MTHTLHSPACEQLLADWRTRPSASLEHRLADYTMAHTDAEIHDLLITIIDEDHGTPAEVSALTLWQRLAEEMCEDDDEAVPYDPDAARDRDIAISDGAL